MAHTLVVLDNRTFLVPEERLPPKPWEVGQFLEWEVHPEQAKAWQIARMRQQLGRLDELGTAMGSLLSGGDISGLGMPARAAEVPEDVKRAVEGLRRLGGGQAVRATWKGPDAEGLARAVDAVLGSSGVDPDVEEPPGD